MAVADHNALPDRVLNLYLYPVGAWGIGLLVLFFTGYVAYAIPLCYPLALWYIGLSMWWGRGVLARLDAGALTNAEAHAGIRSAGQILAFASVSPAIVFLSADPLAPSAWSTTVGVLVVAGLTWFGIGVLTRIESRWTHGAAMALACFALPLNATGAVTVATMVGLYDVVVEVTPVPDVLAPLHLDDP